ncbi:MAG: glycoside hydrolase family 43 protein, partial [Clostridia bacterium]|nr:glycoside hydrolase family 43 protein [Clostridia bacterium]
MKKHFAFILSVTVFLCLFAFFAAAEETFVNPVANGADPFVLQDDDGTYYLYVTSGGNYGYRVYSSENLVEWESQGYCLKPEDVYIDPNIVSRTSNGDGTYTDKVYPNFWAPEVIKEGDTYYMVYTAQEHIGIATADSPLGPFKNDATSYLIPYEITGFKDGDTGAAVSTFKCIDGHFYRDDDGTVYLYFVSNNAFAMNGGSVTKGNNIWGGPFDLETLTFASGYPKLLVKNESETGQNTYAGWENQSGTSWLTPHKYDGSAVAEGPAVLKHNGTYYLTFSQDSYSSPQYSVFYVTADSPMGPFNSNAKTLMFITDDQSQSDPGNPHLYGTAHHAFTTSPDGSQLIIVYHAHRSINAVAERRICLDVAGFDASGNLFAGTVNRGHPTATAQPVPSGGTLGRAMHLTGPFADLTTLPVVYVANEDGDDGAAGTAAAPFKTITAACAALPSGGTIVLTQLYNASGETSADYLDLPAVDGPLLIKGAMSATPFSFKFLSVNSDVYFDNISFWPATLSNISVIECNFNNVVMGEGVSCISQPTRKTFPYLVGGKWWSGNTTGVYTNFNYTSNAEITTDKAYTLTVLSGTWSLATHLSLKSSTPLSTSADHAETVLGGDAKIRPAKAGAPTVTATGGGARISFNAVANAPSYVIYKDGEVVGYTESTSFTDSTWTPGDPAVEYTVAGYVNGACIGDASNATTLAPVATITSVADYTALMNDSSMWGGSYILTADIDLDGVTLTPIGNSTTPFSGTFDGDGHTISGIEINGTDDVGLFGLVGAATIRNLTVSGSVTGTGERVGGIVGRVQAANITIENCVNRCTVSAGTEAAGGIVGRLN